VAGRERDLQVEGLVICGLSRCTADDIDRATDYFKLSTGINTRKLYPTSRLVSHALAFLQVINRICLLEAAGERIRPTENPPGLVGVVEPEPASVR
jgi:hypothetical protein